MRALQSFLPSLSYGIERDGIALSVLCELPRGTRASSQSSGLLRSEHGEWKTEFAITAPSTRHEKLIKLIGSGFFQAGRQVLRKNAELQYREATPPPTATLEEHLQEFDKALSGWQRKWLAGLSAGEREKYEGLTTQEQRDAFHIIRNWSQTTIAGEFKIRCQSLGDRIGISLKGANKQLQRFCEAEILKRTKPYVPNKFCARFRWTAAVDTKRTQGALISSLQWNGDPGAVCLTERRK